MKYRARIRPKQRRHDPMRVRKRIAIAMAASGAKSIDIARKLEMRPEQVCAWRKQLEFQEAVNEVLNALLAQSGHTLQSERRLAEHDNPFSASEAGGRIAFGVLFNHPLQPILGFFEELDALREIVGRLRTAHEHHGLDDKLSRPLHFLRGRGGERHYQKQAEDYDEQTHRSTSHPQS